MIKTLQNYRSQPSSLTNAREPPSVFRDNLIIPSSKSTTCTLRKLAAEVQEQNNLPRGSATCLMASRRSRREREERERRDREERGRREREEQERRRAEEERRRSNRW
jgi:hypothetical protein